MRDTVAFKLRGPLAAAVAVEWTDTEWTDTGESPAGGADWRPCAPLGAGRWRLTSAAGTDPAGIGLRCRLTAAGAWSPVPRDRRTLEIPAAEPGEILIPPALLLTPALAGTGRIGSEVSVAPGLWSGVPAPDLAPRWCRDGVEIPGAVTAVYVPGPPDDLTELTCRIVAASRAGSASAVTASLRVTHMAPEVVAAPFEEIFDQGGGAQEVATAGCFTGAALSFAVAGAGATIDAATGVVAIPTDKALPGEIVTVTATNSGGSVSCAFMVTIEAWEEDPGPPAMAAAEWEVSARRAARLPGAPLVEVIRVLSGPALEASRLYRAPRADTIGAYPEHGFQPCVRHPEFGDADSAFHRCWVSRDTGPPRDSGLVPGATRSTTLRYTLDPATVTPEAAVFSADSDRKIWTVADTTAPPPVAAAGWKVLPAISRAEYQAFVDKGELSGDYGQYMLGAAQSEARPDLIYTCQDSGGVWVSLDHGNSWNNLKNRGLYARFTTGIAVDPLDYRRLFVITQGGGHGAEKHIGLQRSLDGGLNWERVVPNRESPGRSTQGPIDFAPSSKDPKLGYATRWYCIIQKYSYRNDTDLPHEFHMSSDGGATWSKVRDLAVATFGSISHLVVSPADQNLLYVHGGEGLWRFEAADQPGGAITRMSGANGLPSGGVSNRVHVSPDGRTLLVGVSGKGIYRATDAGARWSLVHADRDLGKLHVNPWNPERMIISYAKGKQMKYSTDGGASFAKPAAVNTGPGGRDNGIIHEGSCLVMWHRGNPDRVWAHGGPRHWQSDNGGRDWRPANGYFNGKQHQNWFIDQMFDPVDSDRFGYFMTDFGVGFTHSRGRWFDHGRMNKAKLGLVHTTVNGGAIHPDPSRGIILASVGKMNAGKLVLSRDDGATWSVASAGEEKRQYVGFDLDDPQYCYQWREKSADHGVSWSAMESLPRGYAVSGMTLTARGMADGQAIFAIDRDRGGNSRILRSRDRGASWQRFADSPFPFGILGMEGGGPCRAHPSDPDIFFTKGPNDWTIRKWIGGGAPGHADYNIMGGFPGGVAPDGMFSILSLAIDRRYPEVMYVVNAYDNVPYKFFRTTDGGLTWENLTEGFPGTFIRGLEVSPVTGEVFTGSPNGSRILPPPYAEAPGKTVGELNAWGQRYLDQPY